jgi:hypothetical protein
MQSTRASNTFMLCTVMLNPPRIKAPSGDYVYRTTASMHSRRDWMSTSPLSTAGRSRWLPLMQPALRAARLRPRELQALECGGSPRR